MRCPTCLFEGKRHTVFALGQPRNNGVIPHTEFWDDDSGHHVHDPTVSFGGFYCSNGHQWTMSYMTRCPQACCDWNLRPEARAQYDVVIPGRAETIAAFRARKLSQWLRLRERVGGPLYLENSGTFFTSFAAVMPTSADNHVVVFGETPFDKGSFIDLRDQDVIALFNGDWH